MLHVLGHPKGHLYIYVMTVKCIKPDFISDTIVIGKECVAVLTMLYKKNGAVSCVGSDYSKVIDVPGYLDKLNLIMGRY